MPGHHDDLALVAGDDWVIPGVLLDDNNNPLDLTNAALEWALIDPQGKMTTVARSISINDPPSAGLVSIKVPRAASAPLAAGRFHDALRVLIADAAETYWLGTIVSNPIRCRCRWNK
jgi:hypothetical protein